MFLKMSKKLKIIISLILLISIYPMFILGYTWIKVGGSELKGGRNGPLDAYRHTFASGLVSYTLGEWAVRLATETMESWGSSSNGMDIHNNMIGAKIGTNAKSIWEIDGAVKNAVLGGDVNASNDDQITWLPQDKWGNNWLW